MAYTPRSTNDQRYEFQPQDQAPTISKLVRPSNDSHTIDRQNINSPYTTIGKIGESYVTSSQRTGDSAYESIRRSGGDNNNAVQRFNDGNNRQETSQRNNEYARRIPTAHINVDTSRRPADGNARTCVMEINIAVSMGGDRNSQTALITSNNSSRQPIVRSTATIDDVRYIDLDFRSPQNTARLSTDGMIRRPT
ncbi:unnamed protein product [Adineta steineri]|uniref:Uncharacterized protein n=1 Tax=Adineta steineri TaxID=433720 RepID=A0A815CFZ7_9BILA|nr:unnamed protein product [Adineta steineri]CAF3615228.1 unnamed protein product [Adineta steineri]